MINTLSAAQTKGALKSELKRYLSPALLLLDEIGYLPIDQRGADLLFQVISQRYERGSIVLTSNKAFSNPFRMSHASTATSQCGLRPVANKHADPTSHFHHDVLRLRHVSLRSRF